MSQAKKTNTASTNTGHPFLKDRFLERPKNILLAIGVVLLVTFMVYFPVLDNDFVNWDDDRYVTNNLLIRDFSWQTIKYFFTELYFMMYIPLTMITYTIEYALVGLNPWLYHLNNLFLHLLNTTLVYLFVFRLSHLAKIDYKGLTALMVAALFGIHTMHVESVAWISERKDVLYTFFYLLSLSFYVHYLYKKKHKWLFMALVALTLGALSKAMAVTLSVSLLAVDYLVGRNFNDKKLWLEKIPFFAVSLIFGLVAIVAVGTDEPFKDPTLTETENVARPFFENLLYASYGFTNYVGKLIFPYHLSAIYPYPEKPDGNIPPYFWVFPLFVAAIASAFFYYFKRNRIISFSIFFFTVNLILVLQLFSYQSFIMTDRYSYLASVGFSFLLARGLIGFYQQNKKLKPIIFSLFSIYMAVLGVKTYVRNDVWQNSETLWTDVIEKYPRVIISYYNRGNYYQDNNRLPEAIASYSKAIELNPTNIGALSNRGISQAKMGNAEAALADFDAVVKIDPNYANIYSNRGNALTMLGQYQQAIADYTKAIERKPDFVDGYFNRGNARLSVADYKGAIADYQTIIALGKTDDGVLLNLAKAYQRNNQDSLALLLNNQLLANNPQNAAAYFERYLIFNKQNKPDKAVADLKKATQLNPKTLELIIREANLLEQQNPQKAIEKYLMIQQIAPKYTDAYVNLGVFYGKLGQINNALTQFSEAIEQNPKSVAAYNNRAYAYDLSGKPTKAIDDYTKAIELAPNNLNSYLFRGMIYKKQNRLNEALADFNYILNQNPNAAAQVYFQRAEIFRLLNQKKNACADFQQALSRGLAKAQEAINQYCK